MKLRSWIAIVAVLITAGVLYAATGPSATSADRHLIAKGEVAYASFRQADGTLTGWASVDNSKAVPGGNGGWNEHRFAELYDNFLVVTKPAEKGWGTLVIPTSRLVEIQFSDQ